MAEITLELLNNAGLDVRTEKYQRQCLPAPRCNLYLHNPPKKQVLSNGPPSAVLQMGFILDSFSLGAMKARPCMYSTAAKGKTPNSAAHVSPTQRHGISNGNVSFTRSSPYVCSLAGSRL